MATFVGQSVKKSHDQKNPTKTFDFERCHVALLRLVNEQLNNYKND